MSSNSTPLSIHAPAWQPKKAPTPVSTDAPVWQPRPAAVQTIKSVPISVSAAPPKPKAILLHECLKSEFEGFSSSGFLSIGSQEKICERLDQPWVVADWWVLSLYQMFEVLSLLMSLNVSLEGPHLLMNTFIWSFQGRSDMPARGTEDFYRKALALLREVLTVTRSANALNMVLDCFSARCDSESPYGLMLFQLQMSALRVNSSWERDPAVRRSWATLTSFVRFCSDPVRYPRLHYFFEERLRAQESSVTAGLELPHKESLGEKLCSRLINEVIVTSDSGLHAESECKKGRLKYLRAPVDFALFAKGGAGDELVALLEFDVCVHYFRRQQDRIGSFGRKVRVIVPEWNIETRLRDVILEGFAKANGVSFYKISNPEAAIDESSLRAQVESIRDKLLPPALPSAPSSASAEMTEYVERGMARTPRATPSAGAGGGCSPDDAQDKLGLSVTLESTTISPPSVSPEVGTGKGRPSAISAVFLPSKDSSSPVHTPKAMKPAVAGGSLVTMP